MGSRPSEFQFSSAGALRLYSTDELLILPPPDWLIQDIMPEGGLVGLYGAPESAKSFAAIDMMLCVATGTPWHGHEVKQGFGLYVAAEGGAGIGKRVRAWMLKHNITTIPNMAWLIESITVNSGSTDVDTLMHRLDNELQEAPGLIVIDTLARCFDGNENEQEDMGTFIDGIDRLRHEYGATVITVHHTRLDGGRERGNTAFRGGLDTMISVKRDETAITLECSKQKDADHFGDLELNLVAVPECDSCILIQAGEEKARKSVQILSLLESGPLKWDQWCSSSGLPKTTFHRFFSELNKTGKIIKENGMWGINSRV